MVLSIIVELPIFVSGNRHLLIMAFLLLDFYCQPPNVMKKSHLFTFMAMLSVSLPCHSQSSVFRPFKAEFGISRALTLNETGNNGIGLFMNPMYNVTDQFSIGPRFCRLLVSTEDYNYGMGYMNDWLVDYSSILLVVDGYLSTNRTRVFLGLGIGLFRKKESFMVSGYLGGVSFDENKTSKLGIMPRIGFNIGHFKATLNYNITGGIYNYISISAGLEIGGGFR